MESVLKRPETATRTRRALDRHPPRKLVSTTLYIKVQYGISKIHTAVGRCGGTRRSAAQNSVEGSPARRTVWHSASADAATARRRSRGSTVSSPATARSTALVSSPRHTHSSRDASAKLFYLRCRPHTNSRVSLPDPPSSLRRRMAVCISRDGRGCRAANRGRRQTREYIRHHPYRPRHPLHSKLDDH